MHPCDSSDLKSADAAIMARPGRLHGLMVITDGTNAATVTLYDNASAASGKVLAKHVVAGASLASDALIPMGGIVCNNGIYADVSGTGANYIVHYTLG